MTNHITTQRNAVANGTTRSGLLMGDSRAEPQHADLLGRYPASGAQDGDTYAMLYVRAFAVRPGRTASSLPSVGAIRTVIRNADDSTRRQYPWVLRDNSNIMVWGHVANDHVDVGERVWAPGHGEFTVASVVRSGGDIVHLMSQGGSAVTQWYRTTEHRTKTYPNVGDWIVAENVPGTRLHGGVGRVTRIDEANERVYTRLDGSSVYCTEWIILGSDEFVPGTIVTIDQALDAATTEFKEWAVGRVAEVINPARTPDGKPVVRTRVAHRSGIQEFPVETVSPIGHVKSEHPPKAWIDENVAGTTPVADKPVEENVWQQRYEALVEALRDEAESRGWCDEYEDFVSEHGVIGGQREKEYEVAVTLTTPISASTLDDLLRAHLNHDGNDVDVRTSVDIEHRATVTVRTTREALREGEAHDEIGLALQADGWQYDTFEVDDYEPA